MVRFKELKSTYIYPLFFTIVLILIVFQYQFSFLESVFYDLRIRTDLGINFSDNIVLITQDDESDEFLGESYPYTYAGHSRMIDKVFLDSPSVVTYFSELSSATTKSEQEHQAEFKKKINHYKKNGGEFIFAAAMDLWGTQLPPEYLRDIEYSYSLINKDNLAFSRDNVVRRALINISGEDTLHLNVANKFREKINKQSISSTDIQGAYYVPEADATFSLFRYYTSPDVPNGLIKKISFHNVLVGNFPKHFFKDKIVLIGPSYISNAADFVLTPFKKEGVGVSKLMVHAEIIQSLVENKTILAIPKFISKMLAILIAIILFVVISRVSPVRGLLIVVSTTIFLFLSSYILFVIFGLWLYLTHVLFTIIGVYYIWVPFRAISEYQTRFAIEEESKLLKKVESLKQNFISLMSHDLKTPVAKIATMSDVLKQKYSDNLDLSDGLNSIIDSTKELNKFITSILDLTKVESQNINLTIVQKDINPIIESVIDSLSYEYKRKNIEVEVGLGPLYPISIDVSLLFRVISNIVENAIKYSPINSKISIKTWDDAQWVYIQVADNGPGIDLDDLTYIFDKFYRVKNDASHSIKGTGLGLYLVRYFVELHGGIIEVKSKLGSGTTFIIKLKNN